jgi:hypothetical protein
VSAYPGALTLLTGAFAQLATKRDSFTANVAIFGTEYRFGYKQMASIEHGATIIDCIQPAATSRCQQFARATKERYAAGAFWRIPARAVMIQKRLLTESRLFLA